MNRISRIFSKCESPNLSWLKDKEFLVGDIHNHCGISYGHGSIEEAVRFASQQLDFFSVTGHYAWPDMGNYPERKVPEETLGYHRKGFSRLRENWPHYLSVLEEMEKKGFIVFPSYEYHHFGSGDYTVVMKKTDSPLPEYASDEVENQRYFDLIHHSHRNEGILAFPHHIGYKTGYRGINWETYSDVASPVVEIISMHGCSESMESPLPYLHTMGPKTSENTMRNGLNKGFRFGVIANTDHHNAAPGSYGFGRTGLWAQKTKDSVWENLHQKRTCALSGDPVEAAIFVNGSAMGDTARAEKDSALELFVAGYDDIKEITLISDGSIIDRITPSSNHPGNRICLPFSFGWGAKGVPCRWDVTLSIRNATVYKAVPRLRGEDIVAPLDEPQENTLPVSFCHHDGVISMKGMTNGNVNTVTNNTQGCVIDLEATSSSSILVSVEAEWKGKAIHFEKEYQISDLMKGNTVEFLDGFVSPSFVLGEVSYEGDNSYHLKKCFDFSSSKYVYATILEKNGSFAVTSPVFFS